jgi:hypothetical protein
MLWGGERALFSAKEKLFPMKRHRGQVEFTFPKTFRTQNIAANGTKLHVRVGGSGPAVVLLHGYGETGDMWVPLAKDLVRGSDGDRAHYIPLQLTGSTVFYPLCLHLFPVVHTTILEQLQFAFHHGRVQNLQLYYIRTANNTPSRVAR